jgi:hypothetical protein
MHQSEAERRKVFWEKGLAERIQKSSGSLPQEGLQGDMMAKKSESWQKPFISKNKSWKKEFRKAMKVYHKKIGKVV